MRSLLRGLVIVAVLMVMAVTATQARYGSLDPCEWTIRDMATKTDQPEVLIRARVRGLFMIEGVVNPDYFDCLRGWWAFRLDELPEK